MSDIWTIGHSTLELSEFIGTLQAHHIEYLADVRSMPGSRRHPHFNSEALTVSLPNAGIQYTHHPGLGGRRSPKTITPDLQDAVAGWTHKSFRSYAAWTLTGEFHDALTDLEAAASTGRVAFMCSEAVPWRCHRGILASVLTDRGWHVHHIMNVHTATLHRQGGWGPRPVHVNGQLTWPGQPQLVGVGA